MTETPAEDVELYPDEMNRIKIAWAEVEQKYMGQELTEEAKQSFAQEVMNRLYEIGFVVQVSFPKHKAENVHFGDNDQVYFLPDVEIISRVRQEDEGHDHARHAFEVQTGMYDGQEGSVSNAGKYNYDASKKLYLP